MNIQHLEPVGYFHFAHSYVRGNWHNEKASSFSLMAKSCHDIDWILWVMGKKCVRISSFGSLNYFTSKNKPEGATARCLDCPVSPSCAYSAVKIYVDPVSKGIVNFPVTHINVTDINAENVRKELETSPYGRCVYTMDNDVLENQIVNMQFEDGSTASFTMIAFTGDVCTRKTKIFGTLGEIETDSTIIKHVDFLTDKTTIHKPYENVTSESDGHGGGDYGLMHAFIKAVATRDQSLTCDAKTTLTSHLMVFEAEKSRLQNNVVNIDW